MHLHLLAKSVVIPIVLANLSLLRAVVGKGIQLINEREFGGRGSSRLGVGGGVWRWGQRQE